MLNKYVVEDSKLGYSLYRVYNNSDDDEAWYLDDLKKNGRVVIHVNRTTGKMYITFLKRKRNYFRREVLKEGIKEVVLLLAEDGVTPQVKVNYYDNPTLYTFLKINGFKKSVIKGILYFPINKKFK